MILEIFKWKDFEKVIKEVNFFIIEREEYPIKTSSLERLETNKVQFKISSLKIPNISSSMVRLNKNYSYLPKSLIEIVEMNNLYS